MPGPESLSPSDPTAFGEYSVVGRLGKGGQGIVYLGRDAEGDEVAIKVLNDQWASDETLRKRFEKEVTAARKVDSFCTAAVYEAQLDVDPPYVVSEYVQGQSLQEAVDRDGPRKGASLQRLAVATATALVAIHQAGIVHRDFKPGNVLLGDEGPRVIDFGIARMVDGQATLTSSIIGTPSYMAPEQIAGDPVTHKVDIFAWACVIAYASTGRAPFGADSVPAVVHRVVSVDPDLSEIPETVRPVLEACLNKDAARRPSARQLLMRLLGHDEAEQSEPPTNEMLAEGQRLADHPASGPQAPLPAPPQASGPQTPLPYPPQSGMGRPMTGPQQTGAGPPMSGPQQTGGYYPPPQPRPMPGPGATGANQGMGGPPQPMPGLNTGRHPGPMPAQPPQAMPPQQAQPKSQPQPQQSSGDDPVLSQGWVIPAVLVAIIILLLLLVLLALAS